MSDTPLETNLTYFGISPWEIEVVYGLLNSRFKVIQNEIESEEGSELAGMLNIDIPLPFNEEFFKWFEYSRWDKMKFLFKEMKRRRGDKHAIKIQINFSGTPKKERNLKLYGRKYNTSRLFIFKEGIVDRF